jgi:EAL domain-containing protein (putative c-di-GMP-specific phosphodiesterase class I)
MIHLCNELGIDTIAEFVETEEQAEQIKSWGVILGQGYLFGKPSTDIDHLLTPPAPASPLPAPSPPQTEAKARNVRVVRQGRQMESWAD